MKAALTLCTLLLFSAGCSVGTPKEPASASAPVKVWSLEGFDQPESVLHNAHDNSLYVSNINGSPLEDNGKGYISRLSSEGKLLEKFWVTGLGAPKGMALYGGSLYVADLQTLHIIDIQTRRIEQSLVMPGSKMLNDIAVDKNGVVYVSDLLGGGIYRYAQGQFTPWIAPADVPHPNGLFYQNDALVMATWGEGMQKDFTTQTAGGLYGIDTATKTLTPLAGAQRMGNLDGIAAINGALMVNDWINGNVFRYRDGQATLLFNAGKSAADISALDDHLLVPVMFEGRVDTYRIR